MKENRSWVYTAIPSRPTQVLALHHVKKYLFSHGESRRRRWWQEAPPVPLTNKLPPPCSWHYHTRPNSYYHIPRFQHRLHSCSTPSAHFLLLLSSHSFIMANCCLSFSTPFQAPGWSDIQIIHERGDGSPLPSSSLQKIEERGDCHHLPLSWDDNDTVGEWKGMV